MAEASTSDAGHDPAAHLRGLSVTEPDAAGHDHAPRGPGEDPADDGVDDAGAGPVAPGGGDLITPEAFAVAFRSIWSVPGALDPRFAPLAVSDPERPACDDAAGALYDLLRVYAPVILRPGGDTLAKLAIVIPFILGKVQVARACLAQRPGQHGGATGAAGGGGAAGGQGHSAGRSEPLPPVPAFGMSGG